MGRSLLVAGPPLTSIGQALRLVLSEKPRDEPLVVLDYLGRAASALGPANAGDLTRDPIAWIDLSDRRRPCPVFRLGRSRAFSGILGHLLQEMAVILEVPLAQAVIDLACKHAWDLADGARITLVSLLRCFGTREGNALVRWFDRDALPVEGESALTRILSTALRYPAVWALSEASGPVELGGPLQACATLWLEVPLERFEPVEQKLVTVLAEVALLEALLQRDEKETRHVRVLHAFPSAAPCLLLWDVPGDPDLSHVVVLPAGKARKASRRLAAWLETSPDIHAPGADPQASPVLPLAQALRTAAHRARLPAENPCCFSALDAALGPIRRPGLDLYELLCRKEALRSGWFRVARGSRVSGTDGVTVPHFKAVLEAELESLAGELSAFRYRCRPLRREAIPKPDGGTRTLGIPCVRDRVVQAACLALLEPLLEPQFSPFSFGYRPNRNAHDALATARGLIGTGLVWAVIADIHHCFDSLDHGILLSVLEAVTGPGHLLDLVDAFLKADVLDWGEVISSEIGVPQGEALSPLLANLYLDQLDRHFERTGLSFVRYADDTVVFTRTEAEARKALEGMAAFLHAPLRLSLKPSKTDVVPVSIGIPFLGFVLKDLEVAIHPSRLERAISRASHHLRVLGSGESSILQRAEALERLNALVRGFRSYFHVPGELFVASQLRVLDEKVAAVGNALLPEALRNDPEWIRRERFSTVAERVPDLPFSSAGEYPQESSSRLSPCPPPASPVETVRAPRMEQLPNSDERTVETGELAARESATAVFLIAGRLHVLAHGSFVLSIGEDLVVRKYKKELARVPFSQLQLVHIQGHAIGLSAAALITAATFDLPVVISPLVGAPAAVVNPVKSARSDLRAQQVLRRDHPDVFRAGVAMLAAKMVNQAAVLNYFGKYRRRTRDPAAGSLRAAAAEIRTLAGRVARIGAGDGEGRARAMGLEGQAAAIYWSGVRQLLGPGSGFEKRTGRGAADLVNQALNYTYGILYAEVWRALVHAGLDPYFGILHGSAVNQGGLVFDLIEEFRAAFADRTVVGMLGRGLVLEQGREGFLATRVRYRLAAGFAKGWHRKIRFRGRMRSPEEILERNAGSLVRLFQKGEPYRPYRMRW